jgi:two-component system sensor histidine kinase BaeS
VALTALFSVGLTGLLSFQAARDRVPRAFGMTLRGGPGPAVERPMGSAAAASEQLLDELQGATWRAGVLALVVAVGVGTAVALQASRPIDRLAEATRRYAGGERTARAKLGGPREVADLGLAFNDLADRLQGEDVQRRRFTADVAHELRTPLTVLRSELEAIEDGLMAPDPERVAQLVQQVELLGRLVQDLGTLASAESGALELRRERFDLGALAAQAAAAFEPRAAGRGVTLAIDVEPTALDGDPGRVLQIVNALLDNALRHAPAGGHVWVRVAEEPSAPVLEIADDGSGVPEAERELVFRRFYRADPARSRASGGSGLGLAIVAALVERHGGTVAVDERPGGGARFLVRWPAAA